MYAKRKLANTPQHHTCAVVGETAMLSGGFGHGLLHFRLSLKYPTPIPQSSTHFSGIDVSGDKANNSHADVGDVLVLVLGNGVAGIQEQDRYVMHDLL